MATHYDYWIISKSQYHLIEIWGTNDKKVKMRNFPPLLYITTEPEHQIEDRKGTNTSPSSISSNNEEFWVSTEDRFERKLDTWPNLVLCCGPHCRRSQPIGRELPWTLCPCLALSSTFISTSLFSLIVLYVQWGDWYTTKWPSEVWNFELPIRLKLALIPAWVPTFQSIPSIFEKKSTWQMLRRRRRGLIGRREAEKGRNTCTHQPVGAFVGFKRPICLAPPFQSRFNHFQRHFLLTYFFSPLLTLLTPHPPSTLRPGSQTVLQSFPAFWRFLASHSLDAVHLVPIGVLPRSF